MKTGINKFNRIFLLIICMFYFLSTTVSAESVYAYNVTTTDPTNITVTNLNDTLITNWTTLSWIYDEVQGVYWTPRNVTLKINYGANNIHDYVLRGYFSGGISGLYNIDLFLYNFTTLQYDLIYDNFNKKDGMLGSKWVSYSLLNLSSNYYNNSEIRVILKGDSISVYGSSSVAKVGEVDLYKNLPPTIPVISNPINNTRHYNNSMNFTWNQSTDTEGQAITYDFWLSSQPDFSNTVNRTTFSNNWSGSITTTDGTLYYSKVRSYDGVQYSNWSNIIQFTENTVPTYQDVVLSPSTPTAAQNLTATFNYTDAEGDTVTNSTRWYKDGVLQSSLNDTLTVLASGNTSNGETWYFKVYGNDSYEQGSEYSSNQVIIGSSNIAPSFTNLSILSTIKYNKSFWINASGITDDNTTWQVQAYIYNNSVKEYLGNSSWTTESSVNYTVTNPWTSGIKTIYVVIYDSGNVTGAQNLTSSELTASFTVDTTLPTVTSSSVDATSITIGNGVTITASVDGQNANISSVIVQVERPDATTANWTMTCSSGETANCTKSYTSTSDIGTYYVRYFYVTDDSSLTGAYTSELTFTASAVQSGNSGGGSGGGGSGAVVIIPSANVSDLLPVISFNNVTDSRSTADLAKIGKCLSQNLMLSSQCSGGTITIVSNPMNYWVLVGAYLFSFIVVFLASMIEDKPRTYFTDTFLYGTFTVIFVMLFSLVGLNMFVFNLIFESSLPGWMFASFGMWAIFVSLAGDQYTQGGKGSRKSSNREFQFINNVGKEIENTNAIKMWNKNVLGKK